MSAPNVQPTRLSLAITEYVAHLRAKGRADNTVASYQTLFNRALVEWGDIATNTVEPIHIDRLMAAAGWSASTQSQYVSQLRAFWKWLRACRYTWPDHDPTATWGALKVPEKEHMRVPRHDFWNLLEAAKHPRDRAVVAVSLFTFLRGSEIVSLRWRDVRFDEGILKVKRHKTKTLDDLAISNELREELVRWQNWYRSDQGIIKADWFVTPSKGPDFYIQNPDTGRLMVDRNRLARLKPDVKLGKPYECVQRSLKACGYDTHGQGVHTIRRSGAYERFRVLSEQGTDMAIMEVASTLGHSDIRTSQRYIGWNMAREKRNENIIGRDMFPGLKPDGNIRLIQGGADAAEA